MSAVDTCLNDVGLFLNLQPNDIYWYETEFNRPNQPGAFTFYMALGNQGASGNLAQHDFFAWAVRDGDVGLAPIPIDEPGSLPKALAALGVLMVVGRRRTLTTTHAVPPLSVT